MRTTLLFSIFPLLAASVPEPEPEAKPEPQFLPLIPLAIGGLTLGAIGLGAAGAYQQSRTCECDRNFNPPACSGSWCECKNQANIACWASKNGACQISLQVCPANGGTSGSPTAANGEFPPCGRGLPNCANGKTCRKLDSACSDSKGGGSCIGLCIPPFQQQSPKQQQPPAQQGGLRGQQAPKAAKCPASFACPPNTLCVQDPHDTLAPLRGPSYKCVDQGGICGGFQNTQCKEGQLCVPDPRMQCQGQGCTGVCA